LQLLVQKKKIRELRKVARRKPDVKKLVRQELLKTHPKTLVNHLMGKKVVVHLSLIYTPPLHVQYIYFAFFWVRPGFWTEKEIIQALLLRAMSLKAYKFICRQKLFPLPGVQTLRDWIKGFNCEQGMQTDSMKGLFLPNFQVFGI
jgi:hypothetical protein